MCHIWSICSGALQHCITAQVPSTWRPLIEDSSTLQLLLDFYKSTKPPLSSSALECLVCHRTLPLHLYIHEVLVHQLGKIATSPKASTS